MSADVVERLRAGIKAKAFTLKQVAEASGIPEQRLSDLKNRGVGQRVLAVLARAEKLEAALDKLNAPDKPARRPAARTRSRFRGQAARVA